MKYIIKKTGGQLMATIKGSQETRRLFQVAKRHNLDLDELIVIDDEFVKELTSWEANGLTVEYIYHNDGWFSRRGGHVELSHRGKVFYEYHVDSSLIPGADPKGRLHIPSILTV